MRLRAKRESPWLMTLAVLLQTWNAQHYQFRPFTEEHFREIAKLLQTDLDQLVRFRNRGIDSATKDDLETVEALFNRFEQVLGPVGAVKSLHLLGPNFFRYGIGRLRSVIVAS